MEEANGTSNGEPENSVAPDITEVLGDNVDLWYKRRMKMPDLVGRTLTFNDMEYRNRDDGGYYILHITNGDGQEATVTTSSPKIKAKASALINRKAFPVRGKIVPDGKGYDIVKGDD